MLSHHQVLLLYTLWFLRQLNTLPEAVYCCFTGTTLFTELFTCFYDQSYRLLSRHQVSLLYTFQFLRYLNVLPEAIYCCFTRTTLFTTMFTVVCSLKSMCIPSFVWIGCCVSELHGLYVPIVMYGLRLFIVVLQELPNCLHVCTIRDRGCYHITKFCCSIRYGF